MVSTYMHAGLLSCKCIYTRWAYHSSIFIVKAKERGGIIAIKQTRLIANTAKE